MAFEEPKMGPEFYKTYAVAVQSNDWRKATCAEVDCDHYLHGWRTRIEGLPSDLLHEALTSGRKYSVLAIAEGESWLYFEAGQLCFREETHRIRIGLPELYVVRDGDRRGNPRGTKDRLHQRPADWQDDFANHQQGLAEAQQRG
jgi:hypothetical protein